MNRTQRPVSVTAVAVLYIATGVATLAYDLYALAAAPRGPGDLLLAAATELVAVVSGLFMLRGARWAPWLALAWIAFHVAISLGSVPKTAVHGALLAVIAVCLFRPQARAYFRTPIPSTS